MTAAFSGIVGIDMFSLVKVVDTITVFTVLLTTGWVVFTPKTFLTSKEEKRNVLLFGLLVLWIFRALYTSYNQAVSNWVLGSSAMLGALTMGACVYGLFGQKTDMAGQHDVTETLQGNRRRSGHEPGGGENRTTVEKGFTYLLLERGAKYGFDLFSEASKEEPALCFSRTHPRKIRERHALDKEHIYWLTDRGETVEHGIEPFRLNFIGEKVIDFIDDHDEGGVVLIDGLEYLLYKNPFEKIMGFVQRLMDNVGDREDIALIVALENDSISDKKTAMLRSEFDEVRIEEREELEKLHS